MNKKKNDILRTIEIEMKGMDDFSSIIHFQEIIGNMLVMLVQKGTIDMEDVAQILMVEKVIENV